MVAIVSDLWLKTKPKKWTLAVVETGVVVTTTPSVESSIAGRIGCGHDCGHDHTEFWSSQSTTGM